MRGWLGALVSLSLLVGLSGCADDSTPKPDAEAQTADAQSSSSDAASASDAASTTTGDGGSTGTKDAGSANADASSDAASVDASRDGSTQSGQDTGAGGNADTGSASSDASAGAISCDRRKVLCRIAEPNCPANQVASVENGCFGPCVVIDQCSCAEAAECPHEEMYACHRSAKHCGPYVN